MTRGDDLFRPPAVAWQRLSPNYFRFKLVKICTVWPIVIAAMTGPLFYWGPPNLGWIALAGMVVIWLWRIIRWPRAFRRWGYAETETDIHLTRGLAWRQLTSVPYGRMQLVNVSSGPLERAFGLAKVEMITSSTSGTIIIPGLALDDAAALRDRLVERGELLQAGI